MTVPTAPSIETSPKDGRWYQIPTTANAEKYVRWKNGGYQVLTKTYLDGSGAYQWSMQMISLN